MPEFGPCEPGVGVLREQVAELLDRLRVVVPEGDLLSVGVGVYARRVDGVNVEAVSAHFQVVDDLFLEDVADVGAGGDVESREPLLGYDGATDDVSALQNLDIHSGSSKVSRGDQSLCPPPTITTLVFSAI